MDEVQYQYRVMFDNMAQGAFYQSRDGSLIDVNKAALAMFGLTREEFLRPAIDPEWRCVRDDGSELPQEQYPSVIALLTGQPVRDCVAGVFNTRRQVMIWLNINAIPMFREGESHPYQVFVTLHDVSEQKRMNDIHLSRIRLMQFAHLHPLDELMVEALDELERLTGSVIGFYHFYDDHDRCVTLKAWSTRTATLFCQVKDKGGHYSIDQAGVWVDCIPSGEPVIHNDYATLPHRRGLPEGHAPVLRELVVPVQRNGRIVAILGIGNKPVEYSAADVHTASLFADLTWDIAERKQAKMLLLQANETLEQRVSQRTADLQAAIREQEAFSYSVSHDLRAPLRHINSFSALLQEDFGDLLPDEATGYLDRVRCASSRMGALIDHLLELSR
jgi:PAS domain S-box-containing protein